jgi:magnesium-transporting ATPase (P-type)
MAHNLTTLFLSLHTWFNTGIYVFLLLCLCILILCLCVATLTEVFPCFFLSCKASARAKLAKTGQGPHSSFFCVVLCIVCFVSFCVLFCVCMCTVLLPPAGYPIAVNKYVSYRTFMCRWSGNLVSSTSCNSQGLSRPAQIFFFSFLHLPRKQNAIKCDNMYFFRTQNFTQRCTE